VSDQALTHDDPFKWLSWGEDSPPTPISIPLWVPPSVANRIFIGFRGTVPEFNRLRISTLLNDLRLKDVFSEIFKRSKTGNGHPSIFFRPVQMDLAKLFEICREPFESLAESLELQGAFEDAARLVSQAPRRPEATDWNEIQQFAADYLFLKLDEFANEMDRPIAVTATEVAEREQEVLRVKTPLAEIASILRTRGLAKQAEWLDKAAWHWELEVYRGWENSFVVLPRPSKKHPMNIRGCVWYFAEVMNEIFGINMPSIIAKLAGLAVPGISISRADVENILKDYDRFKRP
jgi:hypothetical protein